ncbi:L-rhamnose mutarotase [Roseateles sp. YR242]|uniref:L-rhamnose mutarotase n=1 Tax=Roseateles sp. YR242 TaxID=1855305 RepID=UPI0008BAAAAD|nr:L-rhamnose mutarotase [Roseateles sp. YR242]SEL86001.1 L-rhamnose mutarotase [Roseateles sp. YR242]
MEHCLLLDLKEDPALIDAYEAHHRAVWPEVQAHLKAHGVLGMRIYRLGTRLCMVMDTDDQHHDPAAMAAEALASPRLREWEALMGRFQQATPWTVPGTKWTPATRIFDFSGLNPPSEPG